MFSCQTVSVWSWKKDGVISTSIKLQVLVMSTLIPCLIETGPYVLTASLLPFLNHLSRVLSLEYLSDKINWVWLISPTNAPNFIKVCWELYEKNGTEVSFFFFWTLAACNAGVDHTNKYQNVESSSGQHHTFKKKRRVYKFWIHASAEVCFVCNRKSSSYFSWLKKNQLKVVLGCSGWTTSTPWSNFIPITWSSNRN